MVNKDLKNKIEEVDWLDQYPVDLLFTDMRESVSSGQTKKNDQQEAVFEDYSTQQFEIQVPIKMTAKMITLSNFIPKK